MPSPDNGGVEPSIGSDRSVVVVPSWLRPGMPQMTLRCSPNHALIGLALVPEAGSTSAERRRSGQFATSTRSVTFAGCPSLTVQRRRNTTSWLASHVRCEGEVAPRAGLIYVPVTRTDTPSKLGFGGDEGCIGAGLGLVILNSSLSYMPCGAFTAMTASVAVLPSGSETSVVPVSNSSQSPLPSTVTGSSLDAFQLDFAQHDLSAAQDDRVVPQPMTVLSRRSQPTVSRGSDKLALATAPAGRTDDISRLRRRGVIRAARAARRPVARL